MTTATPETELDLDGSTGVVLAPIRGRDVRRGLGSALFVKRPAHFTAKFGVAVALIGACWIFVALVAAWWTLLIAVPVLGLLYAHLVELQHECLHEHAYNGRRINRLVGFLCGIPMLSSYWHYKYEHLRHHAFLGTPNNQEFFNYRFKGLDSVGGFLRACFHLGRYLDVFANIGRSIVGRLHPCITKPVAARRVRQEYRAFAVILVAAIAVSALTRNWYLVFVWVIPTLLVAEPTHFLIELSEHFGLNTQTDPNVLSNTRGLIHKPPG